MASALTAARASNETHACVATIDLKVLEGRTPRRRPRWITACLSHRALEFSSAARTAPSGFCKGCAELRRNGTKLNKAQEIETHPGGVLMKGTHFRLDVDDVTKAEITRRVLQLLGYAPSRSLPCWFGARGLQAMAQVTPIELGLIRRLACSVSEPRGYLESGNAAQPAHRGYIAVPQRLFGKGPPILPTNQVGKLAQLRTRRRPKTEHGHPEPAHQQR